MSVLTKNQTRTFIKEYTSNGILVALVATVRHDDCCGNGHNSFAITGDLYDQTRPSNESCITLSTGKRRWLGSCGCLHEEIAKHFLNLSPLLKWHLTATDGPMHYFANTTYHASKKDWNGTPKTPDLAAARAAAVWPDATDEDLTAPGLTARLDARLPALLAEFQKAVESLGMVY
jgi:hypothetical protein